MPTPSDDRIDRVHMLARLLERLDEPTPAGARRALLVAQERLAAAVRRGMSATIVDARRYAVDRARDVLELAEQRRPPLPA